MRAAPLLLALLLLAPAALAGIAADLLAEAGAERAEGHVRIEPRQRPHPSIHVVGDGGFALPTSGVTGGSGTEADPYRISGWILAQTRGFGIRLEGTRAHVVIEDVAVPRQGQLAFAQAECTALADCAGSAAVDLRDAQNVTIRRLSALYQAAAVRVSQSENVLVQDVLAGDDDPGPLKVARAIEVAGSRNVTLESVHARGVLRPFDLSDSTDVTLRASSFEALDPVEAEEPRFAGMTRLLLEGNRFHNATIRVTGASSDVSFVRNEFTGPRGGVDAGAEGPIDGLLYCGNVFHDSENVAAARHATAKDAILRGNRFEDNRRGATFGFGSQLLAERNLFTGQTNEGLQSAASPSVLRENAFVGNGVGARLTVAGNDAAANWWGSATGPRIASNPNGTGDRITTVSGVTVVYEPWLTAAPDLTVDCGPGPAAPGPAYAPPRTATFDLVLHVAGQDHALRHALP